MFPEVGYALANVRCASRPVPGLMPGGALDGGAGDDILAASDLLVESRYWGALDAMLDDKVLEGVLAERIHIYPVLNRVGGALPIRLKALRSGLHLLEALMGSPGPFQSAL